MSSFSLKGIKFRSLDVTKCHGRVIYETTVFLKEILISLTPFLEDLYGPATLVIIFQNSQCYGYPDLEWFLSNARKFIQQLSATFTCLDDKDGLEML